ncbi:hypothetical protein [Luteibacter sp. 22Crub2.1]|uniref:hypothetical protein n=1 Tax=Luteibacter sp. 22Crub2.1 TaxID=1283288 RepID=UPI0009A84C53|nr:hypothetical protein [Luteibacter sp. 22Crub2.1]SKB50510.1 hypothetical protein SAMN05660880_01355 [Luteibacter sp. 22Crub2.1]
MSAIALTPKLIDRLQSLASERVATDNDEFEAYSWCGGNADDAVCLGVDCGYTDLARELCDALGIPYVIEADENDE